MQILIILCFTYAKRQNFRAFKEIGVEEHDADVNFRLEIWQYAQ